MSRASFLNNLCSNSFARIGQSLGDFKSTCFFSGLIEWGPQRGLPSPSVSNVGVPGKKEEEEALTPTKGPTVHSRL
jgi:hypothetical protein